MAIYSHDLKFHWVNEVRYLFVNVPIIYLHTVAEEAGALHPTVRKFILTDLSRHPYKLHSATLLTERHEKSRLRFARRFSRKPINDSGHIERIMFSDQYKLSQLGKVNKQNCRI